MKKTTVFNKKIKEFDQWFEYQFETLLEASGIDNRKCTHNATQLRQELITFAKTHNEYKYDEYDHRPYEDKISFSLYRNIVYSGCRIVFKVHKTDDLKMR